MILPALIEAKERFWRSIKYSLFPPLGLATLAGYLAEGDIAEIIDEHVEELDTDDHPDLVAIEVYITSAKRAYKIADNYRAKGVYVVLGGLHVTALPEEAARHADTIVTGPAEEAWPRFLADFRKGKAEKLYSSNSRTLAGLPLPRRDLIAKERYLVPNSIVVSRGCPHGCDFCYSNSFFRGGKHFYTATLDRCLMEIDRLSGRHLFFLDDNIFGDREFALELFANMKGMGRVWQGAATVKSILDDKLLDVAVESGLRSLFVGFESLNEQSLLKHGKKHNRVGDYERAVSMLHKRGVMINGSFVFGLDADDKTVFKATPEWAISCGIETATFHILTPYPGTDLFNRYLKSQRIIYFDWDKYDTRHAIFTHPFLSKDELEEGYWNAYEYFYKWSNILRSSMSHETFTKRIRHIAYVGAWKKIDPWWAIIIRLKQLRLAVPPLEQLLQGKGRQKQRKGARTRVSELRDDVAG